MPNQTYIEKGMIRSTFIVGTWLAASACAGIAAENRPTTSSGNPAVPSNQQAAAAAMPFMFWHSQPVRPAETLMISGANFTAGSLVEACRLTDEDPGAPVAFDPRGKGLDWEPLTTLQMTSQLAQVGMPASGEGVFACRVRNGTLAGAARRINAPDAWFAQGDQGETASPGGWIGVFGTCIALQSNPVPGAAAAPQPGLALVADGKVAATVSARPAAGTRYGQFFDLPGNLAPGTYDLFVHNGHGGPQGWSPLDNYENAEPIRTITVTPRPQWPQTLVDVSKLAGSNDDERFDKAIKTVQNGGIIVVPAGTYRLTQPLLLPNRCLLRGEGMEKSRIEWTTDPVDGTGKQLPLLRGAVLKGSEHPFNKQASFSLEELSLCASPTFTGQVINRQWTREPASFHRVTVKVPAPGDATVANSGSLAMMLAYTRNLSITACVLDARNGINLTKQASHLLCSDNNFRWRNIYLYLMRGSSNIIVSRNRFTMAGTWEGNGFTAAMNANPGFAYAGYDQDNVRGLYYARNISEREERDLPHGSIGITFDQAGAAYFGRTRSVTGTKLSLAGRTNPANKYNNPPCKPGATVRIVSGRGAGQSRFLLTTKTANTSELEIDRPWDVEPDTGSWIAVSYVHGKALFIDNRFGNDPLLQTYFSTDEVVFADNTIGVPGQQVAMPVWVEGGLNSWHYQVLDNQVAESGARMQTNIVRKQDTNDHTGPVTGFHIYRNNSATGIAARFSIQVPDRTIGFLIEGNQGLAEIKPGKDADPMGISRHNTDMTGNPVMPAGSKK
jgi:hypothetical protein